MKSTLKIEFLKFYHNLIRWWKLNFCNYYNPYFKTKDGMRYAKMPTGMILRLDNKKEVKKRQDLKELKEFFKE